MRKMHTFGIAGLFYGIENKFLSFLEHHSAVSENIEAQFGTLQINHDPDGATHFAFNLADHRDLLTHTVM